MTKLCELLLLLPVDMHSIFLQKKFQITEWICDWRSFNKIRWMRWLVKLIHICFFVLFCFSQLGGRNQTKGLCRVITKFKKRKRITFVRWPKIAVCTLAPHYRRPNRMDVFVTTASCPVYQSGWTVSPWTVRASIGINTTLIVGPVKKILSREPFLLITSVWLGLPFSS